MSDNDQDNAKLKQKMIEKMLNEADSDAEENSSDDDGEDQESDDSAEDGPHQVKMRFDEKTKAAQSKKEAKAQKGILALKFMERAQEKERQALKAEVNLAVKQIKGEDDYAESDEDSDEEQKPKKFIDASSKFGVKALKTKKAGDARDTGKELDADHVLRAARRVTGNVDSDQDSDVESDNLCRPTIKFAPKKVENVTDNKKKSKGGVVHTNVEFGEDDLQNFNAEKNKLIKEEMTEDSK